MMTHAGLAELYLQAELAYRREHLAGDDGHRTHGRRRSVLRRRQRAASAAAMQCRPATT